MWYSFLADLVVAIHFAYVAYIVGGLVLILVGLRRRWRWIRNPWFRVTHLLAILIVVYEIIVKANCPLTTWEDSARAAAHQPVDGSAFMDRLLSFILFSSAPHWLTDGLYFLFALAIAVAFLCAPPQWRAGRELRSQ
jgi:hypothetical protein